jgi:hypothetical protein
VAVVLHFESLRFSNRGVAATKLAYLVCPERLGHQRRLP